MCGPSSAQKAIGNTGAAFYQTLMSSYNAAFGGMQGILSKITNILSPIFSAGPNQEGFDASTMADLRGKAINASAAQNRNAQVVAGSSVGGNTGVTTGGTKQLEAQIASGIGENLSNEENNINLASKQAGRENFYNAEAGLSGVAGMENPVAYAGAANNAGGQAFGEATKIQDERNQVQADIGGMVAGLAGNFLPFPKGQSNGGSDYTGETFYGDAVG